MRIAFVVHEFPPDTPLGGTGRYAATVAQGLRAMGHAVSVLAFGRAYSHWLREQDYEYAGIPVRRIFPPSPSLYDTLHSGAVEEAFERWLDSLDVELVHFQHTIFLGMGLPEVAKSRGLKVVMTLHDFWLACHRRHLLPAPDLGADHCTLPVAPQQCARCIQDLVGGSHEPAALMAFLDVRADLGRRAVAACDLVLCGSEFVRSAFEQQLAWPGRFDTLPFGVPPIERLARSSSQGPLTFGFMGNITPIKGLDILLEAFRPISAQARMRVFGELTGGDPYHKQIAGLLGELPTVTLEGAYERPDLPRIFSQLDALIVPSRHESFGLIALEAQAAGIPVIASEVGGLAEVVTDTVNGLLFAPQDPAALSTILTTLVAHPEHLSALRSRIEPPLSADRHLEILSERYQALLDGDHQDIRVSIILPLRNHVASTQRCLEALMKATPDCYEVILVDNASTDGTGQFLEALAGDVTIIQNAEDLGRGRAYDQGARAARGAYLLFLSNATEAHAGWLEPLLERLDRESEVAAVAPKLLGPDGTIQHAGIDIVEDPDMPLVGRHRCFGQPADHPEANVPADVKALTGAALLIRRECFEQAGGFEEGDWSGSEGVDLCLRLRTSGYRLVYEPASCLTLHESVSGPDQSACFDRAKWPPDRNQTSSAT